MAKASERRLLTGDELTGVMNMIKHMASTPELGGIKISPLIQWTCENYDLELAASDVRLIYTLAVNYENQVEAGKIKAGE